MIDLVNIIDSKVMIVKVEKKEDTKKLYLKRKKEKHISLKCGTVTKKVHDYKDRKIKYLGINIYKDILIYK